MDFSSNLIITLFMVFSTGLVSGLSPCTLPTVVFVTAYVSGKSEYSKKRGFVLSLAFVLGIAVMLSILGMFAGMFGNVFMNKEVLNYIIAGILIVMGLWLLKVFCINTNLKVFKYEAKKGSGLIGAFLMGIPFGISASPCSIPITASVLAYSASKGSSIYGIILMFTYAIGRSIPLLLVGTFTGLLNNIRFVSKYQEKIEKISGIILIGLAFYFIWKA